MKIERSKMLKKSDLEHKCYIYELYEEDNKSLHIILDYLTGEVEYIVCANNKRHSFRGCHMIDKAIAFFNNLNPLNYEETNEYEKYKELKKKYEKYDGII
jgi:hypothetical protein